MRTIFVSYRREDAQGEAGHLHSDLVNHFGSDAAVFMDVDGIPIGSDFRRAIDEKLAASDVLLAIIGKDWIEAKNESGKRRLDDPNDFVRFEIADALKREIPVIPVLVQGAAMPRAEQLPDDLKGLAYRQGLELTHARWRGDFQLLIEGLGAKTPAGRMIEPPQPGASASRPFLYRVPELPPYEAWLFGALPGFVLLTVSPVLGIDHVKTPASVLYSGFAGAREVGYVPALNWSVTYLLLFPFALFLMVSALQHMARALDELYGRKMIRSNGQISADYKPAELWMQGTASRKRLLWIFAVISPAIYCLGQWFLDNLLRLFGAGPAASFPDYDWGLAGLMWNWSTPGKIANAAFDLLAFFAEGALYSTYLAFFIILLDLWRVLVKRAGKVYIVPDLRSDDLRRGFEVFAVPLKQMLLSALITYLICYLLRLESLYMHSRGASSLAAFVSSLNLGRIFGAVFMDWKSLPAELVRLVDTGPYAFGAVLSCVLCGIVSAFSLIVVISIVRIAAADARAKAGQLLEAGNGALFGGEIADETAKIKAMQIWPLGYLGLNSLVAISLIAVVTLYFYRIGLYFALLTLLFILIRTLRRLVMGSKMWKKGADHSANSRRLQ